MIIPTSTMANSFLPKTILSFVTTLVFLISGCDSAPDNFPKLAPCTVTVTDGGAPVGGATVIIDTVPPTPSLSISAQTDAAGKAVMTTYLGTYAKPGVPAGKLVMSIEKESKVEDTKDRSAMNPDQEAAYQAELDAQQAKLPKIVPPELVDIKKSPLTMDAEAGKPIDWQVKLDEYRK